MFSRRRARILFSALEKECAIQLELINGLDAFRVRRGTRHYRLPDRTRHQIAEQALLSIFTAWETYIEEIFYEYVLNGPRVTAQVRSKVILSSRSEVETLLKGYARYLDWTTPDQVKLRANLLLTPNNPIDTIIGSIQVYLEEMKLIRNRIAHVSGTAINKYESYVARITAAPFAGQKPGKLLLMAPTAELLGRVGAAPSPTILEYYGTVLSTGAESLSRP